MTYFHIGINVTNLGESADFYQKLLGVPPVRREVDYVKFLLKTPGLNLTLMEGEKVQGNQVNHFGFQVGMDEVTQHKDRLKKEGIIPTLEEVDTSCCYAVQDKFWVKDPDGNEWEFFYTKTDNGAVPSTETECCS